MSEPVYNIIAGVWVEITFPSTDVGMEFLQWTLKEHIIPLSRTCGGGPTFLYGFFQQPHGERIMQWCQEHNIPLAFPEVKDNDNGNNGVSQPGGEGGSV